MTRATPVLLLCVSLTGLARGEDGSAKPPDEVFEVVELDGTRVGTLRTTVQEQEGKQLRTTATLELTLRRYGALVRLVREEGTVETPAGRVVGVFLRQGQAGGRQLQLLGALEEGKMHVKIDGGRIDRRLNWSDEVIGMRGQERLLAQKKPKPGDRFSFRRYDPTYNAVFTVQVAVKERETMSVLGARKGLLRVELAPDRLDVPGHSVRPAKAVWWLDEDFVAVRRQTELEGLGTLLLTRTTRDKALSGSRTPAAPRTIDVGTRSLIALNRGIARPYETRSVIYKVTVQGEDDPAGILVSDDHQEVKNVRDRTFELHVHPVRPEDRPGQAKAAAEYLASCRYIDCDDEHVKGLARKAVAGEKDPWKKALRIERWVKGALRTDNAEALGPASKVSRSLRGDCRHHALLTAALCRAEGIPARTAIGLLYVYRGGPVLGFHMWTEVQVEGCWLGLDSTLGRGGVSAAHVKISDHSWSGTESLTPLLPVSRVLGKLRVEVIAVGGR
jgi:transglutaminase-like putative cysteine protease